MNACCFRFTDTYFSIMESNDTFGMWHYRLGTRNNVDTQPDIRLKRKYHKISFHDI